MCFFNRFYNGSTKYGYLFVGHTPPEWAIQQKSCPEKWYTTYCQGPLGEPGNVFVQIWQLIFWEKITLFWFVTKRQTKPCSWNDLWTCGKILTYLKKIIVQIRHVLTVTDNKNLHKFENGSHFWTSLTPEIVDGFGQIFFLIWRAPV